MLCLDFPYAGAVCLHIATKAASVGKTDETKHRLETRGPIGEGGATDVLEQKLKSRLLNWPDRLGANKVLPAVLGDSLGKQCVKMILQRWWLDILMLNQACYCALRHASTTIEMVEAKQGRSLPVCVATGGSIFSHEPRQHVGAVPYAGALQHSHGRREAGIIFGVFDALVGTPADKGEHFGGSE
jgi:hypothetical protein